MVGRKDRPIAFVIDSSAFLAAVLEEPGGEAVWDQLVESLMSTVNWSEVLQKAAQKEVNADSTALDLQSVGLSLIPFDARDAARAAALWPLSKISGLSFGDRACLALADRMRLAVLTAERSWAKVDVGVDIVLIR